MRIHKDKVEHVLRSTDMSAPKTIHLLNKPKIKTAQEETRLTEIERENRILL